MVRKILGSGGGGGGGSTFVTKPDSLRSDDNFEILLGLGSGRWKGLVNGLQSLKLNGVSLENADGSSNFEDVFMIFADGNPLEDQIVSFQLGGGGNTQTVNTQLVNTTGTGTWVSGSVSTPNANYIDIRFLVNQLFYQDEKSIRENTANIEIEMRPSGSATWVNIFSGTNTSSTVYDPDGYDYVDQNGSPLSVYLSRVMFNTNGVGFRGTSSSTLDITGKTTSPYVKELRVAVPNTGNYANKTWEVRVRLNNKDTVDTDEIQERRTIILETLAAVITEDLGDNPEWDGLVWAQLHGKASDQFNGFPEITGIFDTKICQVPPSTVFDPDARTYTNVTWDGSFEEAFTTDPAWQIKEFVEDPVHGIAGIYPGATLDKWDALEASKYFSEQVSDGRGGTHPRFSMNLTISEGKEIDEMMQYLAGAVNSYTEDVGGGTWRFKVDKPEDPVMLFTEDNVFTEFQYSHSDIDTRFNDWRGTFLDESLDYETNTVRVFDQADIDENGTKFTEVALIGCTHPQEALRRLMFRLRVSLNEFRSISFETNRIGRLINPLDTILVADGSLNPDHLVKSTSRLDSHTGTTVTLKRPLRLETGVAYTIKFSTTDGVVERTVTNGSGSRGDVTTIEIDSSLPAEVMADSAVALEATGLAALPVTYRVLSISRDEDDEDRYTISAVQVDSGKWDAMDTVSQDDIYAQEPSVDIDAPTIPAGGLFNVVEYVTDTQHKRVLQINWDRPAGNFLDGYRVQHRLNDGPWQLVNSKLTDSILELQNPEDGTYDFKIEALDRRGVQSNPLVGRYTLDSSANVTPPAHERGDILSRPAQGPYDGFRFTATDQTPIITQVWDAVGESWVDENNLVTQGTDIGVENGATVGMTTTEANLVSQIEQDITDLETTYGSTVSAAQSAADAEAAKTAAEAAEAAAAAHETAADGAKTAAELAETASEAAKTAAEAAEANAGVSATNAATSESNASNSEANASSSETLAAASSSSAAASASAATTSETNAAVSEGNASTSETNAAASAVNANTSATNASTSETNASASASSASNSEALAASHAQDSLNSANSSAISESNASSSASAASTSETNAAASAVTANTAAGTASTAATNASTSETNASASAAAASNSETLAAAYSLDSLIRAGESLTMTGGRLASVDNFLKGSVNIAEDVTTAASSPIEGANSSLVTDVDEGLCLELRVDDFGSSISLMSRKLFAFDPDKLYQLRLRWKIQSNGNSATRRPAIGFQMHGSDGTYGGVDGFTTLANYSDTDGWQEATITETGANLQNHGSQAPNSFLRAHMRFSSVTDSNSSTTVIRVSTFEVADITESQAASDSAAAAVISESNAAASAVGASTSESNAATSAANAATDAGNASSSATAASASETNASASESSAASSSSLAATYRTEAQVARDAAIVAENNAEAEATVATQQAAAATAEAAAAAASTELAARIANQSLVLDPTFADFPVANDSPPTYWDRPFGVSHFSREDNPTGGYGLRMGQGASGNQDIYTAQRQNTGPRLITPGAYYVIEADFTLNAGTLVGSGLLLRTYDQPFSTFSEYKVKFSDELPGAVLGGRYSIAKLVEVTDADAYYFDLFAMAAWTGLGSVSATRDITFWKTSVRSATQAEIDAGVVLPTVEASVSVNQAAIASIEGSAAYYETVVAASGSDPAKVRLTAGESGSAVALVAESITIENPVGGNLVEVARFEEGKARLNNAVIRGLSVLPRSDSEIAMPVLLEPLLFLATDGDNVQYQGGDTFGAVPSRVVPDLSGLPTPAAGNSYDVRAINVTATDFDVYAKEITAPTNTTQSAGAGTNVGGTPQFRSNKPTSADAYNDQYQFFFAGSIPRTFVEFEPAGGGGVDYWAEYSGSFDVYISDSTNSNTLTKVATVVVSASNSGNVANSSLIPTSANFSTSRVITTSVAIGQHGSYEFGMHPVGSSTLTGMSNVQYTTQTSSGTTALTDLIPWAVYQPAAD